MELFTIIQNVLKLQKKYNRRIETDLVIANGNIILRSFHFLEFDKIKGLIKGITRQEAYAAAHEERNPIYCILKPEDIKELKVTETGDEYISEFYAVRAL